MVVAAHYRNLPSRPDYIRHARAMADHAEDAGYALIGGNVLVNPTEYELRRALDILGLLTEDGGEALIYFAGHAIPGNGTIYLLATDIDPMPLVRYDVGGVSLETAWSHPLGSGPSKTTIIIETQGMGGLFSGGLATFGTGLHTLELPKSVTVAISDRDGPVSVSVEALHRIGPVRPPLLPSLWRQDTGQSVIFTPTLIELRILDEPNLAAALAIASLEVHERSSSRASPVTVEWAGAAPLPPVRPDLPPIAIADIEAPDQADDQETTGPDTITPPDALVWALPASRDSPPLSSGTIHPGQTVIEMIQMFEAFRAESYLDQAGIRTIGYGHTGPDAHAGNVITHDRALDLLIADIDIAALAVEAAVTRNLTENQRNALI